jgi:hypothetical protein
MIRCFYHKAENVNFLFWKVTKIKDMFTEFSEFKFRQITNRYWHRDIWEFNGSDHHRTVCCEWIFISLHCVTLLFFFYVAYFIVSVKPRRWAKISIVCNNILFLDYLKIVICEDTTHQHLTKTYVTKLIRRMCL